MALRLDRGGCSETSVGGASEAYLTIARQGGGDPETPLRVMAGPENAAARGREEERYPAKKRTGRRRLKE